MDNSKDEIIEREAEERINSLADEVFELGEFFYSEKGKKEHSVLWQNKYKDIFSKIFCIKYINKEYGRYIKKYNNERIYIKTGDCLRNSLETYDKSKGVFINFFKSKFKWYLKKLYSEEKKKEEKIKITKVEADKIDKIYEDSKSNVRAVDQKLTVEKYLREIETVYGTLQKRQQGVFSAWMTLSLFQNQSKEDVKKYKEYLFWNEEIFEYCIAKSNEYLEDSKKKSLEDSKKGKKIKKVTRRDIAEKIGLKENDFSQRINGFEEKLNALREDWKQYKIS